MASLRPLADRLRPKSLDDFIGQNHILGTGKILRKMVESDKIRSIILFGPPGTGKTTFAMIIANMTGAEFYSLNASSAGTKDIRAVVAKAELRIKKERRQTIVFADEIHRWSKNVQDVLLPSVERGTISLIGATTQNPYFAINPPILSRSEIFEFKHLNKADLKEIIKSAITHYFKHEDMEVRFSKGSVDILLERCGGDARKLINVIEMIVETTVEKVAWITEDIIKEILPRKHVIFDRAGDEHFDGMSAIQNSIQASDPHSAVYWLAWCINRDEDINIICRRLLVAAAEDVGLCDPQCLPYVYSAVASAQQVGFPEAAIILSSAVAYMAMSPRSKASARAIWEALSLDRTASKEMPSSIKDCHYKGAIKLGRGSAKDGKNLNVYEPVIIDLFKPENGVENALMDRNNQHWDKIRERQASDELDDKD